MPFSWYVINKPQLSQYIAHIGNDFGLKSSSLVTKCKCSHFGHSNILTVSEVGR